jgi:hypothetical protein
MKQARVYSLKVWLTAVLIGPVFLGIYQAIVYDGGFVWWVVFGVLFGGTLGAPSFVLLWLAAKWLMNSTTKVICKLCLSVLIIPLAALAFFIGYLLIRFSIGIMYLTIPYIIVAIVAIWLYKLKPMERASLTHAKQ